MQFWNNLIYLNWIVFKLIDWPVLTDSFVWRLLEFDEDHTLFASTDFLTRWTKEMACFFMNPGFTMNARDPNPKSGHAGNQVRHNTSRLRPNIWYILSLARFVLDWDSTNLCHLRHWVQLCDKVDKQVISTLRLCTDSLKQRRTEKGETPPLFWAPLLQAYLMPITKEFDTRREENVGGFDSRQLPTVHDPQ